MLGWGQEVPLQINTLQLLKFKRRYVKIKKDLKIKVIRRPLKQLSKVSVRCLSQEYNFGKFSANYYISTCSRVYFQFILVYFFFLNTFRRMRLNYENYSFRSILFQTLKLHSDNKRLIAKTFDGNTLKMKAVIAIQVIRSKKHYSQLCLD